MFENIAALPEPAIKKNRENTTQVQAVVRPYLRLELSNSAASYFPQNCVKKNRFIFYFADFHVRNWRIPGFDENKT